LRIRTLSDLWGDRLIVGVNDQDSEPDEPIESIYIRMEEDSEFTDFDDVILEINETLPVEYYYVNLLAIIDNQK
jgi:hypothetical protein